MLDDIADTMTSLALPDVRTTTRPQWHVTLQFLGDADVDAVAGALRDLRVASGVVRLGGAGAFHGAKRGTVLWLGVREGADALAQAATAVAARLTPLGHEPEAREYHPHLTLARAKRATDFTSAIASIGDRSVGAAWTPSELVVFESRLHRDGARYEPRHVVPFTE